ncbi:MAG: zinc-dependent peptidase [Puniceicoccales bacterium]
MSVWETLKSIFSHAEPRKIEWRPEWNEYLQRNLPLFQLLPTEMQQRLREKTMRFVATTRFEGCGGLELDDEIILTIAAQAALLVINQPGTPYARLTTVLVYPTAFGSFARTQDQAGVMHEGIVTRLGESSDNGTVALAWDSVQRGARNIFDGHNVTFHEFAHQLDQADGSTDGTPTLPEKLAYQTWGHVLTTEFDHLREMAEKQQKSVIDYYGATNHAEFFAVATESFFEKPEQMRRKHPELYEELKAYYQLDPAEWFRQRS